MPPLRTKTLTATVSAVRSRKLATFCTLVATLPTFKKTLGAFGLLACFGFLYFFGFCHVLLIWVKHHAPCAEILTATVSAVRFWLAVGVILLVGGCCHVIPRTANFRPCQKL